MVSEGQQVITPQASRYLAVDPQTHGRLRTLKIGDVELDLDGYQVVARGTLVHLPRTEFMILRHLMENAGRVVTQRSLWDNIWGPDRTTKARHYLPVHIYRIRKKIENNTERPSHIRTVRNIGYVFDRPQHN
jgi:two-component system alkaline phosphatase synthesis response regulator PhoP